MERDTRQPDHGPMEHSESRILYYEQRSSCLNELGIQMEYEKDHVLIEAGTIPDFCYLIEEGRVISYEYTPAGNMRVYHLHEKNSLIGEEHLLFDFPAPISFKTGIKSKVRAISKKELTDAIMAYPDVCMDLLGSVTVKFQSTLSHLRYINLHSIVWKVADLLLNYAHRYGEEYDGKVMIKDKISQQKMSDFLGANRISIVNAVGELKKKNLIEQINGYYVIRDIPRLEQFRDEMYN